MTDVDVTVAVIVPVTSGVPVEDSVPVAVAIEVDVAVGVDDGEPPGTEVDVAVDESVLVADGVVPMVAV